MTMAKLAQSALLLALAALLVPTTGFKFMKNWKVPTLQNIRDQRVAAAKFGDKKLVVITGTSSGLGRKTAGALLRTGQYHVVGAVRDLDKMEVVAEMDEFDPELFTPMHVELNNFSSVHEFVENLKEFKAAKPIDRLICNAGVYQPSLPYAKWSVDGHEQQMQINFLSHFLLVSKLIEDLAKAPEPRCIMVGSVTGNDNTVGGGGVYPIADLKELDGLKLGAKNPISMFDGYNFDGAKAYKDSKLCLMMTANTLHDKYHKQTGIAFSSIYPGCLAESPLFREKRPWFRKNFPIFMKYITGGFVSEQEAGQRLFQVAHDPRCCKSGVYWSWNGGPREGRGEAALEQDGQILGGGGGGGGWDSIYENDQSDKVLDKELGLDLFKYSSIITGAAWPPANQPKSPCPTLNVVGAVTKAVNAAQEAKRMQPQPGMVGGSVKKGVATVADVVIGKTLGGGIKGAQSLLLGSLPEEATTGSFQEEAGKRVTGRKRAWVKAKARAVLNLILLRTDAETEAEAGPKRVTGRKRTWVKAKARAVLNLMTGRQAGSEAASASAEAPPADGKEDARLLREGATLRLQSTRSEAELQDLSEEAGIHAGSTQTLARDQASASHAPHPDGTDTLRPEAVAA